MVVDQVDWAALHRAFACPAPTTNDESIPHWLALDLAEERAAIMEHEGGLSREDAEKFAYQGVSQSRPK